MAGVIGQNAVENNQYAQFYACNDKKQCVLVDDKPLEPFTFLEEWLIAPVRIIGKGQHILSMAGNKNKIEKKIIYPTDTIAKKSCRSNGI